MERLLKAKETAELLGVSLDTIRKWCSTKFIPFYKFGKGRSARVGFRESQLEPWLKKSFSPGRSAQRLEIEASMKAES